MHDLFSVYWGGLEWGERERVTVVCIERKIGPHLALIPAHPLSINLFYKVSALGH